MIENLSSEPNKPRPQPGPEVTIYVNNLPKSIHRGRRTVEEIKLAGGVPLADVLEQLIDGTLTPLPNDGAVTIKGDERFLSHVSDGGSA